MNHADPLGDTLFVEDRLPLEWEVVPHLPSDEVLARMHESNEGLLKVCATLDDAPPRLAEDSSDVSQELARLDAKLNLLLELVGKLVNAQGGQPDALPVQLGARGVRWVTERPCSVGTLLELSLHVCPHLPQPLRLYASVLEASGTPDGVQVTARFEGLSTAVQEGLERLIFRRHRRNVAQTRARERQGS